MGGSHLSSSDVLLFVDFICLLCVTWLSFGLLDVNNEHCIATVSITGNKNITFVYLLLLCADNPSQIL